MNLQHVQKQRAQLLQRIALQRSQIKTLAQPLKSPAHFFDQGHAMALKIKKYTIATSLGSALFSMLVFRKFPLRKLGTTALLSLMSWWRSSRSSSSAGH